MRRMIPIATTLAVLASTAVSATQRSMQLPSGAGTQGVFAPPVMFETNTQKAEPSGWATDGTKDVEPKAEAKAGTPKDEAKSTPVREEAAEAQRQPRSGKRQDADKEKGASLERSTPSDPQKSPQKAKVPARTSPAPVETGVTTAGTDVAENRSNAPSNVAADAVTNPKPITSASTSEKLAESAKVPAEPEKDGGKKIRDVTAAPIAPTETVEKARAQIEDGKAAERAAEVKPKPEPAKEVKAKPHFTGLQGKAKPLALASLKGEDAQNGERLSLTRQFGNWTLTCDMHLSRNERICGIQQVLRRGEPDAFSWQLATSAAGKPVIVFDFTDKADADKGLSISIAGFDKTIPATEWTCADNRCAATMPITGPVSSWFTNASQIHFRYDRSGESVKIQAAMSGFETAVQALQNPLGLKTQVAGNPSATSVTKTEKTAQAN